jgi:hypothetical protein
MARLPLYVSALCITLTGCDPVRTTRQSVQVQVADGQSGGSVVGAQVSLKYDFDRGPLFAHVEHNREWWEQLPWHTGTTNWRGQAWVGVEYTVLDRTIGPWPPGSRDNVSNQPYLVRVTTNDLYDQVSLMMRPGESSKGIHFTVSLIKIGKPRYVETR